MNQRLYIWMGNLRSELTAEETFRETAVAYKHTHPDTRTHACTHRVSLYTIHSIGHKNRCANLPALKDT